MAYISMITAPRELTEAEEEQLATYLAAQVTAETTNNVVYRWGVTSTNGHSPEYESQNVRLWSTSESATGYQALLAGFSPAVPVAVF